MNAPAMPELIPFEAGADWPNPDFTLLKPNRPPAPVLSDEAFNRIFGPWAGWIRTAAEAKGAPVDYVALSLLTTASAVIGNARWVSPWQDWKEPPVLWGMLIGYPSAGKSPALDAVLDTVKEIEAALSADYKNARNDWNVESEIASITLSQWKADAKRAIAEGDTAPDKPQGADAGPPPIRERIRITDTTTEKVAELLAASWRGLLLFRDELSGWLTSMDRYLGGGDRPFWLEAYGGRSYTVDRKSNPEPVIVDHLSISVLGGTQPDKLETLLVKTDDDGLLARFLTVFPDPVPLSRPKSQIDHRRLMVALENLRDLSGMHDENGNLRPVVVPFTDEAADVLQDFRQQCREWETDVGGILKGHIGKMPGLAVRISNVLAHLDWAHEVGAGFPNQLDVSHIGRACHLVGEHYRLHAYRAYGAASVPVEIRNARRIAEIILKDNHRRLKVRDIQRMDLTGLQSAKPIEAALTVLEQADFVRRDSEATGGRPSTFYMVNPKLWRQK